MADRTSSALRFASISTSQNPNRTFRRMSAQGCLKFCGISGWGTLRIDLRHWQTIQANGSRAARRVVRCGIVKGGLAADFVVSVFMIDLEFSVLRWHQARCGVQRNG